MTKNEITLKDIYEVVNRLEERMDKRMCEVEERVNILEDFKAKILGMAAIIAAFVGGFSAWLWKRITGET